MKILYFDYWTKGIKLFVNIDKQLKALGYNTLLLHVESRRSKNVNAEEIIDGILCRDISYYRTRYLLKILKIVKPDIVISVNSTYLLDRTLVLACRKLNIKTVYLMNGKKPIGSQLDSWKISFNNKKSLVRRIGKSFRYLKFDVPNYICSLFYHNHGHISLIKIFKVLFNYFSDPIVVIGFPICREELIHDKCLAFANNYIEHWIKFGYKRNQIFITGNPEHDTIARKEYDIDGLPGVVQSTIKLGKKYAVYLEEANVEHMVPGWTDEYRNDHLEKIAQRLYKDGYLLIVKLHPLTILSKISNNSCNMLIFSKCDIATLIYHSTFCISHMSTTIDFAVLLNKPILIPQWRLSKRTVDYYIYNGVGNKWDNISEDLDLSINDEKRDKYIREYITVTKGNIINNIVNHIANYRNP